MLTPEMQMAMSSLHFLSPDSKSQAFDHKANGYARGEGTALIVVKPLSDAIRDGNVIRAVIRGTCVNQDGKTPGKYHVETQRRGVDLNLDRNHVTIIKGPGRVDPDHVS
jgi:acyl transferase domain-containing protein